MPWTASSQFNLEFEEAVRWMRNRVPVTDDEYADIETRARRRAFTVGNVAQLDIIQQVHDALSKALETGMGFDEFKHQVGDALRTAWGNPDAKTAGFRTNTQQAYSAGRYQQLTDPSVLEAQPYWLFDAVLDSRTSDICQPLDGTVLKAKDAWWDTHTPPMHHNCRSGLRSLTRSSAERRGITSTPPSTPGSPGFGFAPDASEYEPDWSTYKPELLEAYRNSVRERFRAGTALIGQLPTVRRVALERARDVIRAEGVPAEISREFFAITGRADTVPASTHAGIVFLRMDDDVYERLPAQMRYLERTGYQSTGDVAHIAWHEIGHALWLRNAPERAATVSRQNFSRRVLERIRVEVGRRATASQAEFVAEVYAGLKVGKAYPEDIMKLYDAAQGPRP